MKSQKEAKKQVDECVEVAIHSVSNLLSNLLKTRSILHTEKDAYMAQSSLLDARGCVNHLNIILGAAEKAIISTLPERPQRPTGLKVTPKGLVAFDKEYFSYFDPDGEDGDNEFYRRQYKDKDAMYRHLATWAFDDGDTKAALREIKKSFGDEVAAIVRQKLRDRDHDT